VSQGFCVEVYKWVDENGKVHFSQTPPNHAADQIQIENNLSSEVHDDNLDAKQKEKRYLDYLRQERLDTEARKAKQNEERAKLQARCERRLADYQDLKAGGRFYELNEQGERVFLSNDEMNEAKKMLKEFLDKSCRS
jgi:hypothetical protein